MIGCRVVKRKHAYYTVIHAFLQASCFHKKIIAFARNIEYYRSHEYENIWHYTLHRNPLIVSPDRLCRTQITGKTGPANRERTVLGH
jgi:hypothetical protein